MKLLTPLLLGWISCASLAQTPSERPSILTSPNGGIAVQIAADLLKAVKGDAIEMSAYTLTDQTIVAALVKAHAKGVTVNVMLDLSYGVKTSAKAIAALKAAGIEPRSKDMLDTKGHHNGICHAKFYLLLHNGVVTLGECGSYNFTGSADKFNFEDAIFLSFLNPFDVERMDTLFSAFIAQWEKAKPL